MIDFMLRAATEQDFNTFGVAEGWLIFDDDGLRVAGGVDIDRIGSIVTTPGTYDEDGNQLTAPVIDNNYHVNVRLHGFMFNADTKHNGENRYSKSDFAKRMMAGNKRSFGKRPTKSYKLGAVELIDPNTLQTPSRVWASGMNF